MCSLDRLIVEPTVVGAAHDLYVVDVQVPARSSTAWLMFVAVERSPTFDLRYKVSCLTSVAGAPHRFGLHLCSSTGFGLSFG